MLYTAQRVHIENMDSSVYDYDMIIRAEQSLYHRAPKGTEPIYLLNESEVGYDNLETACEEIYKVLMFQPASQNPYWISEGYSNDSFIGRVLSCLGEPVYKDPVFPTGLQEVVSDAPGAHANRCLVGRIRMGGAVATGACNENAFSLDAVSVYYPENEQFHFSYAMSIMPEDCIARDGYYLFGADVFDYLSDDPDEWRAYIALVTINIWKPLGSNKYNCNIVLSSYLWNLQGIEARYGGEPVPELHNTNDPNNTNQNNNNNGGNGDGDTGSDNIPVPELPDSDMTEVNSVRVYAPTNNELKAFMEYLHSASIPESLVKLWQNPIQGVVSLHYLPYPLRLKSDNKEQISIMGIAAGVNASAYVAEQWQTINFGWVKVGNDKNNYLDYSPYTRTQIYLPGVGIKDLNTDDIINKYVRVKYNCDNVTGQFVAFILVGSTNVEREMCVKYAFSGCVAAPFPISQNNWGNTYIAAATLAAGAVASGVAAIGGAGSAAAGAGTAGASMGAAGAAETAGAGAGVVAVGAGAEAAKNIGCAMSALAKPSITRAGTVSGTTSLFGVREPYLIIERPNQQDFKHFNKIKGYPCGKTYKLGDLTGYNEIESVHLTGIPATVGEINEIESLLKGGVIL